MAIRKKMPLTIILDQFGYIKVTVGGVMSRLLWVGSHKYWVYKTVQASTVHVVTCRLARNWPNIVGVVSSMVGGALKTYWQNVPRFVKPRTSC